MPCGNQTQLLTGACLPSPKPDPGRAELEATEPAEYEFILRLLYVAVRAAPNRLGLWAMAHLLLLLWWKCGNSILTNSVCQCQARPV
jgi:hypothetical protein